jgi:hypothetical protein
MANCRFCFQPILWARTASGKAIPLDPEPGWAGRYEVTEGAKGALFAAIVKGRPDAPNRYRPHMQTCPMRNRRAVVDSGS